MLSWAHLKVYSRPSVHFSLRFVVELRPKTHNFRRAVSIPKPVWLAITRLHNGSKVYHDKDHKNRSRCQCGLRVWDVEAGEECGAPPSSSSPSSVLVTSLIKSESYADAEAALLSANAPGLTPNIAASRLPSVSDCHDPRCREGLDRRSRSTQWDEYGHVCNLEVFIELLGPKMVANL